MKKTFSSLLLAAAMGVPALHAEDWATYATKVNVSLDKKLENATSLEIKELPLSPTARKDADFVKDLGWKVPKETGRPEQKWMVVDVPVEFQMVGRFVDRSSSSSSSKNAPARYAQEVGMTVYVLFSKHPSAVSNKNTKFDPENYTLVKKEMVLSEVAMDKLSTKPSGSSDVVGSARLNVPVFVSPALALELSGAGHKDADWRKNQPKVAAVAIDATFNGRPCPVVIKDSKRKVEMDKVFDSDLKKQISDANAEYSKKWRSDKHMEKYAKAELQLLSIAETPYAAYSGAMGYPFVKPMYGSQPAAPGARESKSDDATASED